MRRSGQDSRRGWSGRPGRPRVLYEHPDGAMRWAARRLLEAEGCEVATCPGPAELPGGRCPMTAGEGCALAENADLVWNALGLRTDETAAVVRALTGQLVDVPVVVELLPRDAGAHTDELRGTWVTAMPVSGQRLIHQVDAVLRQSGKRS